MASTNIDIPTIVKNLGSRNLVLVGLMGAGKTTIGRRLAKQLDLPFVDADAEIEKAAGQTVAEIFEAYGEDHFRDGERKVIARLLHNGPQILATGGGAFMNDEIRHEIAKSGVSVWLKADHALLIKRLSNRAIRPLLMAGDLEKIIGELIKKRYPTYEQADFMVKSRDVPHDVIVRDILEALGVLKAAS